MEKTIKLNDLLVENDVVYLMSKLDEKFVRNLIKKHLKNIFLFNGQEVSEKLIDKYFSNFINFIYNNLNDNVIKSNKDLAFYIHNELQFTIENDEYLFKRFFKNKYFEIKLYKFVSID